MDDRRTTLAEIARMLEGQSRRLARVVPAIDDQAMRCEAREAACNAIELVVEIRTLLNQPDIPLADNRERWPPKPAGAGGNPTALQ